MSPSNWLFIIKSEPDFDNIFPLIKVGVDRSQLVTVLLIGQGISDGDFRLAIIRDCANARIVRWHEFYSKNKFLNKICQLIWTRKRILHYLRLLKPSLVLFEWGDGVDHKADSLYRRTFLDIISHIKYASSELKIPSVALPHGHFTKLSIIKSDHVQSIMNSNDGLLPFSNRNSFAAYVFCAEYHQKVMVTNSEMTGDNACSWGSLRYNDIWIKYLYENIPIFHFPPKNQMQIYRVLFFLPKWQNLIDRHATINLIIELSKLAKIQLIVKSHVRTSQATLTTLEIKLLKSQKNILLLDGNEASASLIKGSDVLIDVDSSIAFDAILLKKPYIRPRYLQDNSIKTVYDLWGGAHQSDSADHLLDLLSHPDLGPAAISSEFEKNVFMGSGNEIFDNYFLNLKAIEAGV